MKNKLLIYFLVSFISVHCYANSAIGTKKVSKMIFHDSGNLYIYFEGDTSHSEACDDNTTYVLPKDNIHFSYIYSGLLAAMHSGASVNGYVNGCITIWSSTKPKITRVDLYPNS